MGHTATRAVAGPTRRSSRRSTTRNGQLSGTIIEPNEFRPETARAILAGHRFGASVDFTKTYHGAGPEYSTPVDYVGSVSDDGCKISGVWSLLDWDGSFEMYRDAVAEPEIEVMETVELPADARRPR